VPSCNPRQTYSLERSEKKMLKKKK